MNESKQSVCFSWPDMLPQRKRHSPLPHKPSALILLLAATFFVTSQCFDATSVDRVVTAVQACHAGDNPGLAIAVVKDGRLLLSRGYGVTRVHGSESVTSSTRFDIASLTKAFTATLMLKVMEEDGRLVFVRMHASPLSVNHC